MQALLEKEKEAAEVTRKSVSDTEERNAELVKKLEGSDDTINQLKHFVQRCVPACSCSKISTGILV